MKTAELIAATADFALMAMEEQDGENTTAVAFIRAIQQDAAGPGGLPLDDIPDGWKFWKLRKMGDLWDCEIVTIVNHQRKFSAGHSRTPGDALRAAILRVTSERPTPPAASDAEVG